MSSPHPSVVPVLKIEGPPGSGKTRELAREACRLIVQDGYSPEQMVLLVETPLARKRLRSELAAEAKLAGYQGRSPKVLTLYQWLLGILQDFSPASQHPATLLKETEAQVLLQQVLREAIPLGHPLYYASRQGSAGRAFMGLIQQLQLQGYTPEDVQAKASHLSLTDSRLSLVATVYSYFEQRLQAGNRLCHAQLSHRVLALLESNPDILAQIQAQAVVILVDEAQALPSSVYCILALLGSRLVLAGNEKLSIRSFRGAEPEQFVTLQAYQESLNNTGAVAQVTFLPKQACFRGNEAILSLLNEFLPQPIWEAHELDREQLSQSVKFGYFPDPEQEAGCVAAHLSDFVHGESGLATVEIGQGVDDDPPRRWSDCVVLIRTGHYKQHLLHAFQQWGIPYQWEALSEETVRLQHGLCDLFKVFVAWQSLGVTPEQFNHSKFLLTLWDDGFVSAQEQALWTAENNRHLLRGLETLFLSESQTASLRHLPAFNHSAPGEVRWLLPELLDTEALPPDLAQLATDLTILYSHLTAENAAISLVTALTERLAERWSDEPGFTAVWSALQVFQENLARLDAHYRVSFNQPLPLADALSSFSSLWEGAETQKEQSDSTTATDTVRILGLHQVQGEEFSLVMLPFLVSGEFPYTRELPELLSAEEQAILDVASGYQVQEVEEARLLAVGMSRATQQVVLSSHAMDASEQILPSSFYVDLLQARRRLLGLSVHGWVCRCVDGKMRVDADCMVDYCPASPISGRDEAIPSEITAMLDRYTGASLWANLEKQTPEPLFELDETLNISASSIKTYMQCPRQFYYKHLLRLPQPGSDAAALGTLIHRVMEVFNRQAGQLPYTAQSLTRLAEALCRFDTDAEAFESAGFEERDRQQLSRISPLGLAQLRQRLLASIEDLVEKGYFDRYGSLKSVQPEKTLEGIALPGLERVRFRGAMDAVMELADGSMEILDYKTFRTAYGTGLDRCDECFLETLEPLPDDDNLTHHQRFEGKLSAKYPTDYQLPLYYLACQQDPAIGQKLKAVALQIIRPAFPENPYQGAIRLAIDAERIEAFKVQLIQDINRYIVSPILESEAFEAISSPACGNCAYFGICEVGDNNDLAEDGVE